VVQKVTVLVWLLAALLGIPTLIAKVGKYLLGNYIEEI
jgi:hypothetical protein